MSYTTFEPDLCSILPENSRQLRHLPTGSKCFIGKNPFISETISSTFPECELIPKRTEVPKTNFQQHINSPDISVSSRKKTPLKRVQCLTKTTSMISDYAFKDDCSTVSKETSITKISSKDTYVVKVVQHADQESKAIEIKPPQEIEIESSRGVDYKERKNCCFIY